MRRGCRSSHDLEHFWRQRALPAPWPLLAPQPASIRPKPFFLSFRRAFASPVRGDSPASPPRSAAYYYRSIAGESGTVKDIVAHHILGDISPRTLDGLERRGLITPIEIPGIRRKAYRLGALRQLAESW